MGEQEANQKIDSLPKGCNYVLLKPIPVEISPAGDDDDAHYLASAPEIGMLVCGAGDTPEEARDDLAHIIVDQADSFAEQEGSKLMGLAKFCDGKLREYLNPLE